MNIEDKELVFCINIKILIMNSLAKIININPILKSKIIVNNCVFLEGYHYYYSKDVKYYICGGCKNIVCSHCTSVKKNKCMICSKKRCKRCGRIFKNMCWICGKLINCGSGGCFYNEYYQSTLGKISHIFCTKNCAIKYNPNNPNDPNDPNGENI